ncbi:hypothetical protein DFJ74DRAFT_645524 [Hyaloraphidium curvatum]|nr:hypothetical protein DFJ74DRAFT_645524 [Hyaloraphidium curvatum]
MALPFNAIAYAVTYPPWLLARSQREGDPLRPFLTFIGGIGPAAAALILLGPGRRGELLDSLKRLPAPDPVRAVAVSLGVPLAFAGAGLALHLSRAGTGDKANKRPSVFPDWPGPVLYLAALLQAPFLALEELGWRGFLLPTLLTSGWRPLLTSLLVGAAWGLWHLPLLIPAARPAAEERPAHLLASDSWDQLPRRVVAYVATLAAQSAIMTGLQFAYGGQSVEGGMPGSLWPALLSHASLNAVFAGFKVESPGEAFEAVAPALAVGAALVWKLL